MTTLSEPSPRAPLDDFRSLMAGFPTGVAIVTAMDQGGRPAGMTCSSLCSVTLDPPTLLVCLRRGSPTLASTLGGSGFTVNLMRAEAQATAELFASGAPDRFNRVRWQAAPGFGGPRLLDDAHAIADCRVSKLTQVGDHVVVFGQVCHVLLPTDYVVQPLLYGLRRYAGWPGEQDGSRRPD